MITSKYGSYTDSQLSATKQYIRKQIFYLLLYVDPETKAEYPNVNVDKAFKGLQYKLGGLNSILLEPPSLITVMSLLEAALIEYQKETFDFPAYRKLVLDAGNEVKKIDDTNVKFSDVYAKCEEIDKSLAEQEV